MGKNVNVLRVLVKGALIFLVINLVYACWNPPIGKITLYNTLWPGRLRFPYSKSPNYYSQDYNNPLIQDFDALFGAHIISADEKPEDEFRILLLGDSATWGGHVTPQDMLASRINELNKSTCDGRRIRAYNLGYPWPSLLRDILLLDYSQRYEPDMAIWMVTLHSFEKKPADRDFLVPHASRMAELIEKHGLVLPKAYTDQSVQVTFWDRTIIGQKERLKNIILNQVYGFMWAATGVDNADGLPVERPALPEDVEADISYFDYRSADEAPTLVRTLMFDILRVGAEISGDAPLIVINEPIYMATGENGDSRYNTLYPRWAYDAYRQSLMEWMVSGGYSYYDFWNVLPASEFSNDFAHRNPQGELDFAAILLPIIQESSCP